MSDYYKERLSGDRLQYCYEVAPKRVRQYLEAELNFVLDRISPDDLVLELGCGYGRIIPAVAGKARWVVGIDTSLSSLSYGRELLNGVSNCLLIPMDAAQMQFLDATFDLVFCIQNGISAFHVDQRQLIRESVRSSFPATRRSSGIPGSTGFGGNRQPAFSGRSTTAKPEKGGLCVRMVLRRPPSNLIGSLHLLPD
jgi:SAM-dependent methyltransferase